jgi:tryptophan synthase alpha chain
MTKISDTFAELTEKKEGALIAYLTVGFPQTKRTPIFVKAMIEGGADIIELGIPFSDPIADGPIIQNAVSQALTGGTKPSDAFQVAQKVSEEFETPLVLMTYFNPVFRIGTSKFMDIARKSGVSGVIIPDLPVEEGQDYKKHSSSYGIDTIFLASPSTDPSRLKQIISQTSGYLYLISQYGVTGIRQRIPGSALRLIRETNDIVSGSVPLAVGFGISNPNHVRQIIRAGAAGAIVGSALVKIVEESASNSAGAARKLLKFTQAMKKAAKT